MRGDSATPASPVWTSRVDPDAPPGDVLDVLADALLRLALADLAEQRRGTLPPAARPAAPTTTEA
jgi:hypothetical protein